MNKDSLNHIPLPYAPTKADDFPVWEYHIVPEHYTHPDTGTYLSYGIRVFETNRMHTCATAHIHDVTTIPSEIERLTEQFNRCQLSPIHLEDAIQDYLAKL